MAETILLPALILLAALLYSSVGHTGASGYLAAMALVGLTPEVMKPTALLLNILVAAIGTVQFYRAGCLSAAIFRPFAIGSVPFAFLGGALSLPDSVYKQAAGLVLLFAACRLFLPPKTVPQPNRPTLTNKVWWPIAVGCGAAIGLVSGLTGTGGGIFLTPLLLFMGWAETREAAGVSVAFILVNSVAGIMGHLAGVSSLPSATPLWAAAAVIGGASARASAVGGSAS
jgi:uncharacterized membrane protein YfcA